MEKTHKPSRSKITIESLANYGTYLPQMEGIY